MSAMLSEPDRQILKQKRRKPIFNMRALALAVPAENDVIISQQAGLLLRRLNDWNLDYAAISIRDWSPFKFTPDFLDGSVHYHCT